jgi:uncharacterized protein YjiS (DUF1127 family)
MEMIMSTISSAPAPQGLPGQSLLVGPVAALKRWWIAYLTWRMEQAAIAHLWSLSDRTLKDMGLTRSEIPRVVRGELAEHRRSRRH